MFNPSSTETPDRVLSMAQLLEEIGEFAAAEERFRQFAAHSKRPAAVLALAGFLGRRNRLPEALGICEKAWDVCPAEAVAAAIVSVLYSAPIDVAMCKHRPDRYWRHRENAQKQGAAF